MTIEKVNVQRVRLVSADLNDPVAQSLDWNPLKSGGANFKTQDLAVAANEIRVKQSAGGMAFMLAFVIPGALAFFVGAPYSLLKGEWMLAAFLAVWGAIFGGVAAFIMLGKPALVFDKGRGLYFRGKPPQQGAAPKADQHGWLHDIYALQIISERLSSENGSYLSYEINLVLKDGQRVNVMDHGKLPAIEQSAQELATFLGVPVWQAVN